MLKRLQPLLQQLFAEAVPHKHTFAQAQCVALRMQRFDIQCGMGAGHGKTDCVGAGVDCGDVNRLCHLFAYRQRCASAAEGAYFEARIPNCSPMLCRSCLFTVERLFSPSNSMKLLRLAMASSSRLIIV